MRASGAWAAVGLIVATSAAASEVPDAPVAGSQKCEIYYDEVSYSAGRHGRPEVEFNAVDRAIATDNFNHAPPETDIAIAHVYAVVFGEKMRIFFVDDAMCIVDQFPVSASGLAEIKTPRHKG